MTQPNNGPVNAAGGNEQKKHGAAGNVPAVAGAPASPPVVQTKSVVAAAPIAGDALKNVSPAAVSETDKRRADAWDEGGSRSPGTLPVQMTEIRDPKSKPTDSKVRPPADAPAPGQQSPVLGTPTMEQGIRQAKGDDNRASQPGAAPVAASQSDGKSSPSTAGSKHSVKVDPVQPMAPATVVPVNAAKASSVVPPSAGGSAVI